MNVLLLCWYTYDIVYLCGVLRLHSVVVYNWKLLCSVPFVCRRHVRQRFNCLFKIKLMTWFYSQQTILTSPYGWHQSYLYKVNFDKATSTVCSGQPFWHQSNLPSWFNLKQATSSSLLWGCSHTIKYNQISDLILLISLTCVYWETNEQTNSQ